MKKYACAICGKEFEAITASHLRKHGTTRIEYINKYGTEGVAWANNKMMFLREQLPDVDTYSIERNQRIQTKMIKHNK